MAAFTKAELRVVAALAKGVSPKKLAEKTKLNEDTATEIADELKARLGARRVSDIPERFVAVTGWANDPVDYPI